MTTIACRDGVLAGDSRLSYVNDGGELGTNTVKVFRVKFGPHEGHIVGLTGDLGAALCFLRWYENQSLSKPPRDDSEHSGNDFEALILRPDGMYTVDDHCELMRVADPFIAIGSGCIAATAAMHCGKSAVDAVEIASLCDIRTGGPVVAYSLKKRVR
jgi:ATP-dependent protease HslVU (ClpYQ) peptidase subunit